MYQIEELPDLKVAWHESYKCLNEPLLEYVWEVANHFLPDYAETDTGMMPSFLAFSIFAHIFLILKVFNRFSKFDTFMPGNRLGLYLCRLITKRLAGEIKIYPAYKEGTRMIVTLPIK